MDPAYPRFQKKTDIIECAACHMKVMAKGDWQGWKPAALPDARQVWYCNKQPCQQQYDLLILQIQSGNIPAALQAGVPGKLIEPSSVPSVSEMAAMKARVVELEADLARYKGQSTASPEPEPEMTEPERPPHVVQSQTPKKPLVHVDDGEGAAICGEECDPEKLRTPGELTYDEQVCDDCVAAWAARQDGREAKKTKPTAEEALSAPEGAGADQVMPVAPGALSGPPELMLPPPSQKLPEVDLTKVPEFNQDLISRINDGAPAEGVFLMRPTAYPDIDLEAVNPQSLRKGLGAFFPNYDVDIIDKAIVGEKFLGLAFTLKPTPVDNPSSPGQEE